MKTIVVIPARNEEETIGEVIGQVKETFRRHNLGDVEILVVSDSTDRTVEIAKSLEVQAIRGPGKGLGASMYLGLKEAVKRGAGIILTIDADGQFDPYEIPKVIKPVMNGKFDLVLGSRYLGKIEYRMPLLHRLGNRLLTWTVSKISGLKITDAQTGFRAMTREVAEETVMFGTHTYVQETILDASQKNFRIVEVPVRFRERRHGRSKVVSSIKRYAIWTLPMLIFRSGLYMFFFTLMGVLMLLGGITLGLYLAFIASFGAPIGPNELPLFIAATLFISVGFQTFFFGFIMSLLVELKEGLDRMRS